MTEKPETPTIDSILFIDAAVEDYSSLLADIAASTRVVMLDPREDGVLQMASVLGDYRHLDSLHIISHGAAGRLQLGNAQLSGDNLASYRDALAIIGNALHETGDLLLYGCNLAAGAAGQAFIGQLAELTRADVAASDDLTGNSRLGGDWQLEVQAGHIDSASLAAPHYSGSLGLTVTDNPPGYGWGKSSGEFGNGYAFAALRADGSV